MNLERALVPLAIVIAVLAVAVWLMLVNDIVLGPWLLALLVFFHGWVHVMFAFPKPDSAASGDGSGEYPFDFDRSWLIPRLGLEAGLVRRVGVVVMVAVFALSVLAALATVGIIVPADWWAGLMIAAAAASSLMLALFWSPALVLGFVNDGLMVVLVASGIWRP